MSERDYRAAMDRNLDGLTAVSTGVCPGCVECMDTHEYTDKEVFEEAWSSGDVHEDPHFSWRGCEVCGSSLGGSFEVWHGIDAKGEILHGSRACVNCVVFLANGDLPERWENPTLTLCDDGTMDTVFSCDECGEEIRYSDLSEYRDESGALSDEGVAYAEEEHADECQECQE